MRYRHLRRTVVALLAAVAFLLVIGVALRAVLESRPVRTAAARWLERTAARRGVRLEVGDLHWGLLPPRLRLDRLEVATAGIHADVDHVEADVARVRLVSRTLVLGTVVARGASVRLEGLPEDRPRERTPFGLRVRHLDVDDLRFEGRELPGHLAVSLTGVNAAWSGRHGSSAGYVTVDHARLTAPSIDPIDVAFRSRLEVDGGLDLPRWTMTGDGLELSGRARIAAGHGLHTQLDGTVDLAAVDRMVQANAGLRGTVRVTGDLDTTRQDLAHLSFSSSRIEAAGFPLRDPAGSLTIERDAIHGDLERAGLYGGSFSGRYRLAHLTGPTRPHRIEAHGANILLPGLLRALKVPPAGLAASFAADAELEWDGRDIEHARGGFTAHLSPRSGTGVPVAGEVRCAMEADGLLRFAAHDLTLGSSRLDWEGPLTFGTWEPAWSVTASGADLAEVVPLVNHWIGSEVLPTWIAGTGDLQVALSGPWQRLVVRTRVDAHPLRLPPVTLDRVVAEATVAGSELRLGPTRFSVGDGYGQVEGGLSWAPEAGDEQLDLTLRGTRLPLAAVAGWIGQPGRLSGAFSFTGGLHGRLASPRGSWAVGLDDAALAGLPLGDGSVTVDLAEARFDARALTFDRGLEGSGWWNVTDGEIGGDLTWPDLSMTSLDQGMALLLGETAHVELSFRQGRDGPLLGHLVARWPNARLVADADSDGVALDGALADTLTASARLTRRAGGLEGAGSLHLEEAADLLARLMPDSQLPLHGQGDAHFDVSWPADGSPSITGDVDRLELELDQRPLRLLDPAPFTLSSRGIAIGGLHLTVQDDELFARGTLSPGGTVAGNLSGTLDALLLRFLLPAWEPAGRITGVVELLGSLRHPELEGIAEVSQGSFRLPGTRTILSGIGGTLLLSSDQAVLEGVTFRFMQGLGRCSGQLAVRDGAVNLGLNGTVSNLRYEMLPGLVAYLSGAWRIEGPADGLDLSGDLSVDRASLQRKDDVATLLLDWFGRRAVPATQAAGPRLNLHVEADNTIDLRNPFVRLAGSASVHVTGTAARPGVVGKVELEEGGEVTLQSTRYELERGALTFTDPARIEPYVELEARTWVQNYQITVHLSGTPDRLVPSVASDPPLPENDIYSLLAMGRRDPALGGGALGVNLASGMLAREITSEIDRRTRNLLPVDQIRVDPFAESSTGNPTARISAVKQLSPTWTFMVQSNLSAEREQVVVSRWYLAPGIFVESSRDIDGSYGVDIKLRRPY